MRTRRNGGGGHDVTRAWWALVLCSVAILCPPVLGHHSFADVYIEADTIEVEGDVVEFQFKNPHSYLVILGREALGNPRTYAAEWASPSRLDRDGISKETLKVGDTVRIWASPSRDPHDTRIRLKRIVRPSDGWRWGQSRGENR